MTTARDAMMKVPAVTLGFWIIKILATTLGETGGDSVSMSWLGETTAEAGEGGINGYLIGTAIFGLLLLVLVWVQVRSRKFNPWLYWTTIVASTTVGTTLADFCTRSLGIGYPGGSFLLFACVLASLAAWYKATGSISVNSIVGPHEELFYWVTITFSQTLGTALGDWIADFKPWLRRRRPVFRRAAAGACGPLLRDARQSRVPVLGGIHPHPPVGCDAR